MSRASRISENDHDTAADSRRGRWNGWSGGGSVRFGASGFDGGLVERRKWRYDGVGCRVVVAFVDPNGDEQNRSDDQQQISAEKAAGQETVGLLVRQHGAVSECIGDRLKKNDGCHEDGENDGITKSFVF